MATIFFDMDGTLVDLYGPKDWLKRLQNEDVSLYSNAKLLVNIKDFTNCCKALKDKGHKIGIISYLPWESSRRYKREVKLAKENYIKKYFSRIAFDVVHICDYTTPKSSFAINGDILVDDDIRNRKIWAKGRAFTEKNIIEKLNKIGKGH